MLLERREVVIALGDRRQQALPHHVVVLLEARDLREVALARRVDLRGARERLQELGLAEVGHPCRAVLSGLGLLEIALGGQAEQRLRDLRLARADRQRDVDRA